SPVHRPVRATGLVSWPAAMAAPETLHRGGQRADVGWADPTGGQLPGLVTLALGLSRASRGPAQHARTNRYEPAPQPSTGQCMASAGPPAAALGWLSFTRLSGLSLAHQGWAKFPLRISSNTWRISASVFITNGP